MVYIPPATATLGAGLELREVTLTRGFFIERYEVTVRAYQACIAQSRCSGADHVSITPETQVGAAPTQDQDDFVDTWSRRCNSPRGEGNHPINCVDYANAESYCRFRDRRLPTEAEWELAARGLSQRPYPWGDDDPACAHACFNKNGECRASGQAVATCPAGVHPGDRTPEGIHDLAGNVAEWVSDGLVFPIPGGVDPQGDPAAPLKVVRGGSFYDGPEKLLATYRTGVAPVTAHATIGFRCAADAPGSGPGAAEPASSGDQ
jgi:serine/threonine-protein kinase